jgi:sugar phosphate isomerase/epimerase
MKLGVSGFLPEWQKIDRAAAERVRKTGFLGAQVFIQKPLLADINDVRRVKRTFNEADLEVCQANGWYESLVNPDEAIRAEGIRGLQALVRLGREMDAYTTYVRPGSVSPTGHWFAHPENHSLVTLNRLVDSLRQVCAVAEQEGMDMAIEGHVHSSLDNATVTRQVIDAVGSKRLKFNTDPVNYIGTVRDVHNNTHVLQDLFNQLGDVTVAAHAKDLRLLDEHVVHIVEVLLGTGVLDYATFLRGFQACCPNGYFLIEHLSDEKVPIAQKTLVKIAADLGVPLEY